MRGFSTFCLSAFAIAGCSGDDVIGFEGVRALGVGHDGAIVGGPCRMKEECAMDSQCAIGGEFPRGTCTKLCRDDADCPEGSGCVDIAGGLCLLLCNDDADCRDGYECEDEPRRGASGKATVCIED